MASIISGNHRIEIGFSKVDQYHTILYYIRLTWNGKMFFNPEIVTGGNKDQYFPFTLSMDEGEDYMISFFERLLEEQNDTSLKNFVEPDVALRVRTFNGKIPGLMLKYKDGINVGEGMESFETGLEKLRKKNGNNIELIVMLPQSYFDNGCTLRESWMNHWYQKVVINADYDIIRVFLAELITEWESFVKDHPSKELQRVNFYDPFE